MLDSVSIFAKGTALELVMALAAALALGGGVVWLFLRYRIEGAVERGMATDAERAALVERIGARDTEIARLASAVAALEARAQGLQTALREEAATRSAAEQTAARVPQLEAALGEIERIGQVETVPRALQVPELEVETG